MKQNTTQPNPEEIHRDEAAEIVGVSVRTLERWASDHLLPAPVRPGVWPRTAFFKAVCALLQSKQNAKSKLDAAKLQKTQEEVSRLERERLLDEGKMLTLDEWKLLTSETLPPMRQVFDNLFRVEIPANCAGKSEAAIRAWCQAREARVHQTLRTAEARYEPPAVVAARVRKPHARR